MANKKRSSRSNLWLREHFRDKYVLQAQKKGLRSRAWFKLDEIQRSDKLLKAGMNVIDLGAAPGSWSQYAISKVGESGHVIACDILPMNPIFGVDFIQGNFCDESIFNALLDLVGNKKIQVVMSDMALNMSGIPEIDIPRAMYLVKLALVMCRSILAPGGSFLIKVFHGSGFDEYLQEIRSYFMKVKVRKPNASRARSREVYIVATGQKL